MPTTTLMPVPKQQYFAVAGIPLVAGKVYTYDAGTTNPRPTYTDSAGTVAQANPIILNARGEPNSPIFWSGAYKVEVRDALNNLVYTVDNYKTDPAGIWNIAASMAASSGASLSGYTQAGVGAQPTTVQAELRKKVWADSFIPAGTDPKVTDVTAYIQKALDFANSLGNSLLEFPNTLSSVKCNSPLVFYPNTVCIQGNGAVLDFSALTTGYAISFSQSNTDPNYRNILNRQHPINSLGLLGPGSGTLTAVKGIDQNPLPGPAYWLSGITWNNCCFTNFYRDIEIGAGAFLWNFVSCSFGITGGTGYDCSFYAPAGINCGENFEFIACVFSNVGKGIRVMNGNASIFFRGCSADYNSILFDVSGGYVEWDGYIENNLDTNYWIKVSGGNTVLRIAGQMAVTGNKSNYEIFYSDATAIQGGLILDLAISFGGGVTYTPPSYNLVGGTGRVIMNLRGVYNAAVHPGVGAGSNMLAYGDFESANYAGEWSLASGAIRSTAQKRNGSYSLSFPSSGGVTASGGRSFPCNPGQYFTGGLWYLAPNITGTGGTFYIQVDYWDFAGNSLSSAGVLAITTNVAAWTHLNLGLSTPAPIGTVSARIAISLFGVSTGAPIGYIDDITVAVV